MKLIQKLILTKLHKIRKISAYMLNRFNWNNSFSIEEKKELIKVFVCIQIFN